jgi:hypothetical protein
LIAARGCKIFGTFLAQGVDVGCESGARLHQFQTEQTDRKVRNSPEGDERIMTLHDLLVDHGAAVVAGMQAQRTLTPQQVAERSAQHEAREAHYQPEERAAFDTGSMRIVEQ